MSDVKEYKEKLLVTMGEFLEDHFPLPDRNVKKKKVSCREDILFNFRYEIVLVGSNLYL